MAISDGMSGQRFYSGTRADPSQETDSTTGHGLKPEPLGRSREVGRRLTSA